MRAVVASRFRQTALSATLIFAIIFVNGCANPSAFKAPVGKFRDASGVVIEATKTYITELNKTERDIYIYTQLGGAAQIQIDHIEAVQIFSKEGIATRLNALDQLANYTELLNQLANSDSPASIKAKATDLQTALTGLSSQVGSLTGTDDAKFKAAAGKALPVIGDILQAFVEKRIEDALKQAIAAGDKPVNEIIDAIEVDIRDAVARKKSQFSDARVLAVDQYNRELQKPQPDRSKLQAYANALSQEEDRWQAFLSSNPNDGLDAMKKANQALVKFASTPKVKITDFNSFVDAVDLFTSTANRVGKGIQELRGK
jgi:hypothetical protein